ncbi:hypothetical protein HRM2_p00070 (plasmid) [Desulforapulum autotrophicum HRM2]|uniref:Uncharacterized protein n=1 Tax=Desulforapulum autotrophicum (strain ATCC 43914 / DSM 3382 / VKM B-1955 / HRM2) TaxID=177437 RepID=C0QMK7_DESAH|nr:hypothetical protein [Desulforapulum autotrophicum]ACN18001.1 hypothetical protein HRM2_p00070 [Desulforapulum autotrophicum HRM2]
MIKADFSQIKSISDEHNVPFILGEFGAPMHTTDAFLYFQTIVEEIESLGFGWVLHHYRDILANGSDCGENNNVPCGDSRVLGPIKKLTVQKSLTETPQWGNMHNI